MQCSADEFLWWKLDKSFFHLEDDIFICSVYIPPNNSSREKTRDFDAFTSLEEHIVKYCAYGQVILCGNFNARTGLESDFFETSNNNFPIDLNICFDNSVTSDKYNHRNNRDSDTINTSGRKLLEVCKTFNLRFLNGRSRGDNFGQYTCFRPNGKSVIDYFTTSIDLLNRVHLFKVRHLTEFSIHSLTELTLKLNFSLNIESETQNDVNLSPHFLSYRWDDDSKLAFQSALQSSEVVADINSFIRSENPKSLAELNLATDSFTFCIIKAAEMSLHRKKISVHIKMKKNTRKPWFDSECKNLRAQVRSLGKLLSKYLDNPYLRGKFFITRKSYKKQIKLAKRKHNEDIMNKLLTCEKSNPKAFCDLIQTIRNETKASKASSISPDVWFAYFKKLNTDTNEENLEKIEHLTQ